MVKVNEIIDAQRRLELLDYDDDGAWKVLKEAVLLLLDIEIAKQLAITEKIIGQKQKQ